MRIELLEDVPGLGITGEQVGVNDTLALTLITEHKAIDVDSCSPTAKKGTVAHPIWAAQDAEKPAEKKAKKENALPGADD